MQRKKILSFSIITIGVIVTLFFIESNLIDRETLEKTFVLEAIYYNDEGYVEIIFEDKSQKTKSVVLEILGMTDSFQKTFSDSYFLEQIPFTAPPKYGWQTTPITLLIEHEEYGKIGLKTEIHSEDQPPKPIIYSILWAPTNTCKILL